MDRRDRDRFERDDYRNYGGYSRNDEHYHSARNLTNEFEREYQEERGDWNDARGRHHRPERSYHEGDMGNTYERLSRRGGSVSGTTSYDMVYGPQDQGYPDNYNQARSRYNNYQDDYRSYSGNPSNSDRDRNRDRNRDYGNPRHREPYNAYDRRDIRGTRRQDRHFGSGDYDRSYRPTSQRSNDNYYGSGHRSDELNRYY